MRIAFLALVWLAAAASPTRADSMPPPSDLADYVAKVDASFAWSLKGKTETPAGAAYELHLTSQTWQGFKWEHGVQVFVPSGATPRSGMVLLNTGGNPSPTSAILGMQIASKVGGPVAFLFNVPNQPIFDKKEDALIAETFVRFLASKDSSWPLLFPMAKSVVRAMDALQAFAKQEWKTDVTHFVITGASKRGWTSWMTAATGDPRVKAIAPMVIDTLNMRAQMVHQLESYGEYSQMIHDYTERKLVPMPNTPLARRLWSMVDPWVYRERLTLPKMLINGSNDPYWTQDALNLYWDDLKGDKAVLYVPNAGHDLRTVGPDGKKELIPTRAVDTLAAFARAQLFDKAMPKLSWKYADNEGKPVLTVESSIAPKALRVWHADSATKDFRSSRWTDESAEKSAVNGGPGATTIPLDAPTQGFRAAFAEAEYEVDGLKFTLSTQIRILGAKK